MVQHLLHNLPGKNQQMGHKSKGKNLENSDPQQWCQIDGWDMAAFLPVEYNKEIHKSQNQVTQNQQGTLRGENVQQARYGVRA